MRAREPLRLRGSHFLLLALHGWIVVVFAGAALFWAMIRPRRVPAPKNALLAFSPDRMRRSLRPLALPALRATLETWATTTLRPQPVPPPENVSQPCPRLA